MKTLNKQAKDRILKMIENKDSLISIKSFCIGFGLNTESYSSPVHIDENTKKVTIRYRRENNYYFL